MSKNHSPALIRIFGFSIPLFIAHGLEEYFNNFYNIDSHSKFLLKPFLGVADYQASFLVFQISFWILLILVFLFNRNLPKWLTVAIGLVYVYEIHHIIKAIEFGGYYPGLITALGFPIVAYFYWREFIRLPK